MSQNNADVVSWIRGVMGADHIDHNHAADLDGGQPATATCTITMREPVIRTASAPTPTSYLTVALLLIVGFMCFEVIVGIWAHSLALLSDAGHMLTDAELWGSPHRDPARAAPDGRSPDVWDVASRSAERAGQRRCAARAPLLVTYEAISRLIDPRLSPARS
jgi:cobalt-zinc-cadmium efflux system protein